MTVIQTAESPKISFPPVVIFITALPSYVQCQKDLKQAGLVEDRDFKLLGLEWEDGGELRLTKYIGNNHRQLLIIGMVSGDGRDPQLLAEEMQKRNPLLTTALFSAHIKSGSFNHYIPKGSGAGTCTELVRFVQKFLSEKTATPKAA